MHRIRIGIAPKWAQTAFCILAMMFTAPLLSACALPTDVSTSTQFDATSDKAIVVLGTNLYWFQGYRRYAHTLTTYWQEYDPKAKQLVPKGKTFWTSANQSLELGSDHGQPAIKIMEVEPGDYALIGAGFPQRKSIFVRLKDGSNNITTRSVYIDPMNFIDPQAPVRAERNFMFSVEPGQIVYVGHFEFMRMSPYSSMIDYIRYSQDEAAARVALENYPGNTGEMITLNLLVPTENAALDRRTAAK